MVKANLIFNLLLRRILRGRKLAGNDRL